MNRSKPPGSKSRHANDSSSWGDTDNIRRRTAAIRANWSEAERAHRRELTQRYAAVWQALVQ